MLFSMLCGIIFWVCWFWWMRFSSVILSILYFEWGWVLLVWVFVSCFVRIKVWILYRCLLGLVFGGEMFGVRCWWLWSLVFCIVWWWECLCLLCSWIVWIGSFYFVFVWGCVWLGCVWCFDFGYWGWLDRWYW